MFLVLYPFLHDFFFLWRSLTIMFCFPFDSHRKKETQGRRQRQKNSESVRQRSWKRRTKERENSMPHSKTIMTSSKRVLQTQTRTTPPRRRKEARENRKSSAEKRKLPELLLRTTRTSSQKVRQSRHGQITSTWRDSGSWWKVRTTRETSIWTTSRSRSPGRRSSNPPRSHLRLAAGTVLSDETASASPSSWRLSPSVTRTRSSAPSRKALLLCTCSKKWTVMTWRLSKPSWMQTKSALGSLLKKNAWSKKKKGVKEKTKKEMKYFHFDKTFCYYSKLLFLYIFYLIFILFYVCLLACLETS